MFGVTPSTFGVATPAWTEPAAPAAPAPSASTVEPARTRPTPPDAPLEPRSGPTVIGGPCRYCGEQLPEGRQVTFCPHCGQNVTVQRCPACSTELEVGWRYCITCGRAMDEAALHEPPR
jgi:predicted amidophosphoribosyltransferase